jgi:CHC2 zinc finger
MTALFVDFGVVNAAARANLPAVLERIMPNGRRERREYMALNPRRADRHLGSFQVNIQTGKWADFATGDKGGDPISLVAYVENVSQFDAALRLAKMLGIEIRRSRRGRAP